MKKEIKKNIKLAINELNINFSIPIKVKNALYELEKSIKLAKDIRDFDDIVISNTEVELNINETFKINAYKMPSGDITNLIYTSLNENIATIDSDGLIKGISLGETIIVISSKEDSNIKSLCKIKIIDNKNIYNFSIDNNNIDINTLKPFKININIEPLELYKNIVWSSSDNNICKIDNDMIIPLVTEGNCIIKATLNDKTISCNININVKDIYYYEDLIRQVDGLTHRFVGSQENDTFSTETGMYNVVNNEYYSEVLFNSAHSNQDGWMGKYYALNKGNEIFTIASNGGNQYCYGAIGFVNKLTDIDLYKDFTIGINFRLLEKTRDVQKEQYLLQFGAELNNYRSIRVCSEDLIIQFGDGTTGTSNKTLKIPNYNHYNENEDIFLYITSKQTGVNDKNQRLYRISVFCNGTEVYTDITNPDTKENCPINYAEISANIFKINANTPSQLYGNYGNYSDVELGLYDLNFFNRALTLDEIKTLYDYEKKLVSSYIPSTTLELNNYNIRGLENSDIDLYYDIYPNVSDEQQIDISTTNESVAIIARKRNKVKLLSSGECDIIFTLHRENITKKCHIIVESNTITKAVVEENPDDYITITLPVQNYQNTDTPTQYNMWDVNKEIGDYTIFMTDTFPYPFELSSKSQYSSEITMDGFENVKVEDLQRVVSEKAIAGEYKHDLNYLYIKVPNSVLDIETYGTKNDAFAHYLMNNNLQATFKLHKDGNTYKTIIDGQKQIYIDYDSDNINDDCIVINIEVDNLIPWENIRAGRNVFINNWSYCNFKSGLSRNEYNICTSTDHRYLFLNLKIKKSDLSNISIKGIADYLNSNPLTIYTFNDSKNIESIELNHHDMITDLKTPINLEVDVTPSDATYAKKVYWFSSDENIAKVSKGCVIPIKTGEVDIVAVTDEGKLTDTCHIKIYPTSKVNTVSYMKTLDLKEGDYYTTEGYYYYQDGGAATYQIMSYDDWWNSLKEDLKLISYDGVNLIKNPVDEYVDHTLDNGLVAKLVMGDTVLAEQCGIHSFSYDNLEAFKHAFAYCRERELKFRKGATYLLYYKRFNRGGKPEINEYYALTCCYGTPYPTVGNCEYFNINGNGCTVRLGSPDKFTGRGLFNFSGHINNLTFQGFTIDFQGLLVTETNMTVPTYHALHFTPQGNFSMKDKYTDFGVNIDTTLQMGSFTNIKIVGNKVYQPGTAVSLAQATGADNGGDFILMIAPDVLENFIIDSNYVEDWGRWFLAIDLPKPGHCFNNVQIINNKCIQTNDNCVIGSNGDRRFRGMGWTDFETTAYFKNLLVDNNYIYGLVYFAYNGNTKISENMVVTNNHVERPNNRAYLRGALDLGCSWYYVYTKNLLVENNEFVNCSWGGFGIAWEGEINIRNNKNCSVTCYSIGGNINFENNDGGTLWFANNNNGTNACGANYPGYMTENEDGVTLKPEYEKYRTRKFIFKNNKKLDVGCNGTEILYDLSDNKIFKDTYFDFQDNDFYRLRLDLWESKMIHSFDPYQNGYNTNFTGMHIRGIEKPLNVSTFNKGGYIVTSGDLISDDLTKCGNVNNQNYPYQDASMLGITDEEWTRSNKDFNKLKSMYGYNKIYCEEGGFCPNTYDLSTFTYLKGKGINVKNTVMSSKQLFIALNQGTLGDTLPVANNIGDIVTCGNVRLKYIYPIAKLQII